MIQAPRGVPTASTSLTSSTLTPAALLRACTTKSESGTMREPHRTVLVAISSQRILVPQPNAGPFLLGVVYNDVNHNNFYDIGEGIGGVTITPSSGGYYAVSSSSGGYAIPIGTSGTIMVTASGSRFWPDHQDSDSYWRKRQTGLHCFRPS